jgi:SSS family solute:Na+ symporter
MTRPAAIASMLTGFVITAFWLLFVKAAEAGDIGLVQKLTGGQRSILANHPNWPVVDPILVALPISFLVALIVTFMTKPLEKDRLDRCFGR